MRRWLGLQERSDKHHRSDTYQGLVVFFSSHRMYATMFRGVMTTGGVTTFRKVIVQDFFRRMLPVLGGKGLQAWQKVLSRCVRWHLSVGRENLKQSVRRKPEWYLSPGRKQLKQLSGKELNLSGIWSLVHKPFGTRASRGPGLSNNFMDTKASMAKERAKIALARTALPSCLAPHSIIHAPSSTCVGRAAAEEGEAEPAPGVALDVLRELPLSDCRPLVSNGCS
eukprot:1160255-Pelagomonas_calceolata.AAC.10